MSNELEANELALSTAARGGKGFLSRPEEEEEEEKDETMKMRKEYQWDDEALYLPRRKRRRLC